MVELKKKLTKIGNSYGIIIPRALVECKVFELDEELDIKIEKTINWSDHDLKEKALNKKPNKADRELTKL